MNCWLFIRRRGRGSVYFAAMRQVAVCLIATVALTGCGSGASPDELDAALDRIEELEEALDRIKEAESASDD